MPTIQQPIVAQCTPRGPGAIALIRVSGDGCIALVSAIAVLTNKKTLLSEPTHTVHYGTLVDATGTAIDHVLFLLMHGPKTFTGHDTVEITCHNNQFIISQIITRICELGARMATEGEFSRLAVLNGKMDLLQAEAINEVVRANTHVALKHSLEQVHGSLSQHIFQIEKDLVKALAHSEASFEFIDEEDLTFSTMILAIIESTHRTIKKLKRNFDVQQQLRTGARIALVGPVNAGKSSLFNALLGQKRAIVTSIAGTTRDSIESGISHNGAQWTLIDSAGLRKTDNQIEQAGIKRSLEQATSADIILLVIDGSQTLNQNDQEHLHPLFKQHKHKIIPVYSKSDLPQAPQQHPWSDRATFVSSHTRDGLAALEHEIEKRIAKITQCGHAPFLLNERHMQLLNALTNILHKTQHHLQTPVAYELVSHHLQEALVCISQLTGKSISEQGMNAIFRTFCVGK